LRAYSAHAGERNLEARFYSAVSSKETIMHASLAYVNCAGIGEREDLRLLNTLLSSSASTERNPQVERQGEGEDRAEAAKPEKFQNDPKDPQNPNEVRERHLKKIKR
jgi:hypothetical protein